MVDRAASGNEEWLALVTDYGRPLPAPPPALPAASESDDDSSSDDEGEVAPVPTYSPLRPGAETAVVAPTPASASGSARTDAQWSPGGYGSTSDDTDGTELVSQLRTVRHSEAVTRQRGATPSFRVPTADENDPGSSAAVASSHSEPWLPSSPAVLEVPEMPASSDGGSARSLNSTLTLSVESEASQRSDGAFAWGHGAHSDEAMAAVNVDAAQMSFEMHRRRASLDSTMSGGVNSPDRTSHLHQRSPGLSLRRENSEWQKREPELEPQPEPEPEPGPEKQWEGQRSGSAAVSRKTAGEWVTVAADLDEWVASMRVDAERKHRVNTCAMQLYSALSERRRSAQRELLSMLESMLQQLHSQQAQSTAVNGDGGDRPSQPITGPPVSSGGKAAGLCAWLPVRKICGGLFRSSILPSYTSSGQLISTREKSQALALLEGLCVLLPEAATIILEELSTVHSYSDAGRVQDTRAPHVLDETIPATAASADGRDAFMTNVTLDPLVQLLIALPPESDDLRGNTASDDMEESDTRIAVCDLLATIVARGLQEPAVFSAVKAAADAGRMPGVERHNPHSKSVDSDISVLPLLPLVARLYRAEEEEDEVGPRLQSSAQVLLLSLLSLAQAVRDQEEKQHEEDEESEQPGQDLISKAPPTLHQAIVESIGFEEVERLRAFLESQQRLENGTSNDDSAKTATGHTRVQSQGAFAALPLPVAASSPLRLSRRQKQLQRQQQRPTPHQQVSKPPGEHTREAGNKHTTPNEDNYLAQSSAAMMFRRSQLVLDQPGDGTNNAARLPMRSTALASATEPMREFRSRPSGAADQPAFPVTSEDTPLRWEQKSGPDQPAANAAAARRGSTLQGTGAAPGASTAASAHVNVRAAIMLQKRFRGLLTRRQYWESLEAEAAALEQEIAIEKQPPKPSPGSATASLVEVETGGKTSSRQNSSQQQRDEASPSARSAAITSSGTLDSWLADSASAAAAAAGTPLPTPRDASLALRSDTKDDALERTDSLLVHAPLDVADVSTGAAADGRAQTGVATTADAIEVEQDHDAEADNDNGRDSDGDRKSLGSGAGVPDMSAKLADLQEQLARLMGGTDETAERPITPVSAARVPASAASPAPIDRSVVKLAQPPQQPAFEDEV